MSRKDENPTSRKRGRDESPELENEFPSEGVFSDAGKDGHRHGEKKVKTDRDTSAEVVGTALAVPKGTEHLTDPKWCLQHHNCLHMMGDGCDGEKGPRPVQVDLPWDQLVDTPAVEAFAVSSGLPFTIPELMACAMHLSQFLRGYDEFVAERDLLLQPGRHYLLQSLGEQVVEQWDHCMATCAVHTENIVERLWQVVADLKDLIEHTLKFSMMVELPRLEGAGYTSEEIAAFATKYPHDEVWPQVDPCGLRYVFQEIWKIADINSRITRAMNMGMLDVILLWGETIEKSKLMPRCLLLPNRSLLTCANPDEFQSSGLNLFAYPNLTKLGREINKALEAEVEFVS